MADKADNDANLAAIDRLVMTSKYHHLVAWGRFLGFTPATINEILAEAEADHAPADVIQKIDGKWQCLDDIQNESNRQRVDAIACQTNRNRG